jgi:hypothetical protein
MILVRIQSSANELGLTWPGARMQTSLPYCSVVTVIHSANVSQFKCLKNKMEY